LSLVIIARLWSLCLAAECLYSSKYYYSCWLSDAIVYEEDDEWEIIGKHKSCCGNDDVGIIVQNHTIYMRYLPPKLTEQFQKLDTLQFANIGLEFGTENSLRYCSELETLDLADNRLEIIQNGFLNNCVKLSTLDLARNKISEAEVGAFEGNQQLKTLYLNGNKFTIIRNNIFNPLSQLTRLYLLNNEISVIENGAFDLPNLEDIMLGGNKLIAFTQEALGTSQSLELLYLVENQITEIPRLSLENLRSLTIQSNKITQIEDDIFTNTPKLNSIELQGNLITKLEAAPFESLKDLHTLFIENNLIQSIEPELIEKLPLLDQLWLQGNICVDKTIIEIQEKKGAADQTLDRCYYHYVDAKASYQCEYVYDAEFGYTCEVSGINYQTFRDKFNFTGIHISARSTQDVTGVRIVDSDMVRVPATVFNAFPSVKSLSIQGTSVVHKDLFDICPDLDVLDLSNNNIKELPADAFQNCGRIDNLILDDNLIAAIETPNVMLKNVYIKHLSMKNNVCVDDEFDRVRFVSENDLKGLHRCFGLWFIFHEGVDDDHSDMKHF